MKTQKQTHFFLLLFLKNQILGELKHANLVELLDVRLTADGLELVLDFCETDLKKVGMVMVWVVVHVCEWTVD